ncbi:hypothetical protein CVT24_013176 [Panaeolus cyanescens]|uniref:Glutamine amidotransferase domain-containing protein n=1 Tax=Panaeolus cyanescens TaxID=181874 RepID=A0A409VVY6_9AGAR|nr:hypothetical protein CVT24_013176 [Panaeolus cyanescens]
MKLKIALLICGGLTGEAKEKNGDYYDIYRNYLNNSFPESISRSLEFSLDPYDVRTQQYPVEDEYDVLMITGSASSAYEDIEWINKLTQYIARVVNEKPHIKIIGICFGHQVIARALGGECVPNNGRWEIGPTHIHLTDLGKRFFGHQDQFTIQQMHRDHVPSVPPNFHLLGSTPVSPIQGMVRFLDPHTDPAKDHDSLPPVHVFTTQGHPEFTEPITTAIIKQRSATGAMDATTVADWEPRKYLPTHGVDIVGRAMWDVMVQGKFEKPN